MNKPRPIKLTEADIARFWSRVDQRGPNDCWEWQAGRFIRGYGAFRIGKFTYRANRVAFVIANGDTKLRVLHTCNHPWCCNPAHLYAGTDDDNHRKCVAEGRAVDNRGEKSGHAKLTESDIREIRRLCNRGDTQCSVANKYDISYQHVSDICNRKRWKHIL